MKEYITKHTIANAVRMRRSLFDGTFLIVEGPHDKRVYERIVDAEACTFEIALGRNNAVGAIEILNLAAFRGAVAIVDRDFHNVLDAVSFPLNVVMTDLHDIDCMMLSSPAFDHVMSEFVSEDRLDAFAAETNPLIAHHLAANAAVLGCLRLVSLRSGYNLRFEGIEFHKFVDTETLSLNCAEMIREVLNKSQRHDLDVITLKDEVGAELLENHDHWQIVVGPDVISILSLGLRRVLASHDAKEVSPMILQRCLRLAYEPCFLKNTNLYQSLLCWEKANPDFALLSRI
jgi:hypothetical protein